MARLQYIWNVRWHYLGWQQACMCLLLWIILETGTFLMFFHDVVSGGCIIWMQMHMKHARHLKHVPFWILHIYRVFEWLLLPASMAAKWVTICICLQVFKSFQSLANYFWSYVFRTMVDKTALGEVMVFICLVLITASICGANRIHCICMPLDMLIWMSFTHCVVVSEAYQGAFNFNVFSVVFDAGKLL